MAENAFEQCLDLVHLHLVKAVSQSSADWQQDVHTDHLFASALLILVQYELTTSKSRLKMPYDHCADAICAGVLCSVAEFMLLPCFWNFDSSEL